jgi:hypothetical protein
MFERFVLHDHCADENHVGPFDVVRPERLDVHIDQSAFPFIRKHRGNGKQAKRRKSCLLAFELQRVPKTPIGIRKFRVNKQYFHDNL